MKKIFEQLSLKAKKTLRSVKWVDTLVSNCLEIHAPAMSVPVVFGVQVDNTMNPGTPAYGDAYVITDVSEVHTSFELAASVADNDIVFFNGKVFEVAISADDAIAKGFVLETFDRNTGTKFVFDGIAWAAVGGAGLSAAEDTTITGSWSFDIVNGGVQSVTTDDATLAAATYLFGMAYDSAISPDWIEDFRCVGYGAVGATGYNANRHLLTGASNAGLFAADSNGADAHIDASANGAGDSQINILGDLIITNGVQTVLGHKTGTLAAPPANMLAGEAWADTTDSATNPIYRICLAGT